MAQRDERHQRGGYREHNPAQQMDQYANSERQSGGQYGDPYRGERYGSQRDDRYGGRSAGSDLRHNDPTQAGYGRFGAPDVHHQPSGGYASHGRQERNPDDSYGYGGYGSQGFNSDGSDYRDQDHRGSHDRGDRMRSRAGYGGYGGDNQQDHGRFQGGSGGYASNTGAYAGSQPYGGPSDQLGYGSNQGDGRRHHDDPDYAQWRDEQMRNLDQDYHAWRGERYKKFSEEFGEWRRNRPAGDALRDDTSDADKRSASAASGGASTTSTGTTPGGSQSGRAGAK